MGEPVPIGSVRVVGGRARRVLSVVCVQCGRPFELEAEMAIGAVAYCNGILHARGDEPLAKNEVAYCRNCYLRHRDRPVDCHLELMRKTIRDFQLGREVEPSRVKEVLAGPFSVNLADYLEATKRLSRRAEHEPSTDRAAVDNVPAPKKTKRGPRPFTPPPEEEA